MYIVCYAPDYWRVVSDKYGHCQNQAIIFTDFEEAKKFLNSLETRGSMGTLYHAIENDRHMLVPGEYIDEV